jgi:hypothetical protein
MSHGHGARCQIVKGLTRARSFGLAAFGFAKFLSSFPKRLQSCRLRVFAHGHHWRRP